MYLQAIVAVCLSILHPLLCCYDQQTGTWGDPILEYLKMDPNHVQYEVVPVLHTVHNRNPKNSQPSKIHFKAFGESYKLSLKPTEGLFKSNKHVPMWTVTSNNSNPDGLYYEEIEEASADVADIYQDPTTMSSILLHYDSTGQLQVEGTVGSDLVIRSLPARVLKQVVDKTEGLDLPDLLPDVTPREKRSLKLANHHVVIKRSIPPMDDEYSDFMLMESDHLSKIFKMNGSISARSKRNPPNVVYPEILCIVDYDTYRLHGGDNAKIKRYFLVFWNAVDLRYKLLKNPEVRLNIAGIIISTDRDGSPFLERNRVIGDAVESKAALDDMGKYLFRQRRLPVYDLAITITKLDLCGIRAGESECNRGVAGYAYVGGTCIVDRNREKIVSVGIVEDTGGFSGIIVAAHEVGHLLGAVHDGSPAPKYLGGPGAENCRWNDGYIMSDLRQTENGLKWSTCSVSSFRHFFNSNTAALCLYDAPHKNEGLPKILPGTLLSLDEQCQKDRGTNACFKDDRVCTQLFCYNAKGDSCISYRPAAEGSPCGKGLRCINGKCVAGR